MSASIEPSEPAEIFGNTACHLPARRSSVLWTAKVFLSPCDPASPSPETGDVCAIVLRPVARSPSFCHQEVLMCVNSWHIVKSAATAFTTRWIMSPRPSVMLLRQIWTMLPILFSNMQKTIITLLSLRFAVYEQIYLVYYYQALLIFLYYSCRNTSKMFEIALCILIWFSMHVNSPYMFLQHGHLFWDNMWAMLIFRFLFLYTQLQLWFGAAVVAVQICSYQS